MVQYPETAFIYSLTKSVGMHDSTCSHEGQNAEPDMAILDMALVHLHVRINSIYTSIGEVVGKCQYIVGQLSEL